jgi:outer membrane murein-binding lipoprotein Lpp
MAGHAGEDAVESAIEDGSAAEWAVRRADELDLEPHEFLERIMAAYRAAEAEGIDAQTDEEAVERLEARVEGLESDVDELIEDVRERVIQVKRETDGKADLDHDHESLEADIDSLESEIESLEAAVEAMDDRLDGGFENFEEILDYLLTRTDELSGDVQTLGNAVISLRETVEQVTAREQARARADRLKRKAAKHGVSTAKCESCGAKVDLALLSQPSCPACDETFQELEPNPGFFGSSTLETGTRPALVAPSDIPDTDDIESLAAGEDRSRPDRSDWFGDETTGGADETEEADTDG